MTPGQRSLLQVAAAMAEANGLPETAEAIRTALEEIDEKAEELAHCSRCGVVLCCEGAETRHILEVQRQLDVALETLRDIGGSL